MAVAKKATGKDTSKWVVLVKGDEESYTVYNGEAAAIKAAKDLAEDQSGWSDRDVVIQMFKMDREIKFKVEVTEVPVMTKQRTVKVKE